MADVPVPSIVTATPDGDDTVLGVKDGLVKRFTLDNVGAGINFSAVNATTNMVFNTNGTEKMRLDSAGRLGLGVTPSAWVDSIKVFEFGAKGGLAAAPLDVNFLYNTYYDGSERYRATDFANNFQMSGGAFKWLTAPSGTAGNAITFTQAMTLDASGNLGIGTSSPSNKLSVYSSNSGNDDDLIGLGFSVFGPMGSIGTTNLDGQNGGLKFSTRTANALTEKMTIDSYGNVGIGTTSPDAKLDVVSTGLVGLFGSESALNAYVGFKYNSTILGYIGNGAGVNAGSGATDFGIGSTGARALTFGTNNTERMRIDSAGNLIQSVNTTAATLTTNSTLTFSIVDNSTLRISVRGSDGTTRTATVALT